MPTTITPRITNAGLAAAIAAHGAGLSLQITHVSLGGGSFTPDGTETTLVDIRESVTISSGSVGVGGTFSLSAMFGENTGAAYDAKEIGFFAGNPASGGVLFAVYSGSSTIVHRSSLDFLAQFSLTLTAVPAGSVSVLVDPDAAILNAMLQEHVDDIDPHPQYTTEEEVRFLGRTPGVVFYFAGVSPPEFSLKCNGAAVSRTTYADLFAVIGTMYGDGDGSTTFNLPELRGEFLRGWDDGRGVDGGPLSPRVPGHGGPGTFQAASLPDIPADGWEPVGLPPGTMTSGQLVVGSGFIEGAETLESIRAAGFDRVQDATRNYPRNVCMLACIYY